MLASLLSCCQNNKSVALSVMKPWDNILHVVIDNLYSATLLEIMVQGRVCDESRGGQTRQGSVYYTRQYPVPLR